MADNARHDAEGTHDPLSPDGDPFGPPSISTLVGCLHCGEEYDSYRIEWRVETDGHGQRHGFWCCPIEGCDGKGFGFDIYPVDPDYIDPDGRGLGRWVDDPPPDPDTDYDRPPPEPTQVRCEQCGKTYSSADMTWWVDEDCPEDAFQMSGWMCPTPGCQGMGFGLDVRPTDPAYIDPHGRRILRPGEVFKPEPSPTGDEEDIPF